MDPRTAINTYLDIADSVTPGLVEGLYVVGSVALGDWVEGCSDIDIVAVTAEPATDDGAVLVIVALMVTVLVGIGAFTIDLGALYQRSPKVDLNVSCGATARCAQLQADVAAERARLQSDLNGYRFWPVLQAGFGYVF